MDEKNIGTLARFIGVSPHTIKYYEKIGILAPERDEKSNYRRYHLRICTDLTECIRYRSMGFSLKELDILRKTADRKQLEEMLEGRLLEVNEEIGRLTGLRAFLEGYARECVAVEDRLGEWYVEPCERIIYCRMQTENLAFTGENLASDSINIMDFAPRTESFVVLYREYLEGVQQRYSWGQSLSFDERQPAFEENPDFFCLAPKKIFVTYQKYTGHFVSDDRMKENIREVFQEYSAAFPDHAYAFRIKITHDEAGKDWHYFKIIVPLK